MSLTSNQTRQGQANYVLYRLAAAQHAYPSQCNGSSLVAAPNNTCIFNDVTSGKNGRCNRTAVLCTAGIGWDGPTGLGTPNGTGAF